MDVAATIEALGWLIIAAEIFGRKGWLENWLNRVHASLSKAATWALNDSLRGGLISGIPAFLILVSLFVVHENKVVGFVTSDSPLASWIARLLYEPDGSLNTSFVWLCSIAAVIVLGGAVNTALRLMTKHPSGVLGSVGIVLALTSSIAARI